MAVLVVFSHGCVLTNVNNPNNLYILKNHKHPAHIQILQRRMSQLLPKQHGRRRQYYTPEEVNAHNSADDAWVSVFNKVLDLTELISTNRSALTQPVISSAGRDISHWFDSKTLAVKSFYSQERGLVLPYVPMGRFLHV